MLYRLTHHLERTDMGGVVKTVGNFFDSTPGRVLAGMATGGTSEVSRTAAKSASKTVPGPIGGVLGAVASSGLGGTAGDTLGRALPAAAKEVENKGSLVDVGLAAKVGTKDSVGDAKSDEEAAAQAARETQNAQADATRRAALDLAARTETPQEATDARRRAMRSAERQRLLGGSGVRRASTYLLGGGA